MFVKIFSVMTDPPEGKTLGLFESEKNKKLIANLTAQNRQLIAFPEFKTAKIDLSEREGETLKNLSDYDWIIFPDTCAVEYFLAALEDRAIDPFELDNIQVCACGEAVADRLRFVQLHADVIPLRTNQKEILATLQNYLSGADSFDRKKFLFPKRSGAANDLVRTLAEKNAAVDEISIYKGFFEEDGSIPKLRALLAGGAVDEFVFAAPEDLIALKHILNSQEMVPDLFEKAYATDETTRQNLRENGLFAVFLK